MPSSMANKHQAYAAWLLRKVSDVMIAAPPRAKRPAHLREPAHAFSLLAISAEGH
jgi:hypothetical protein